MRWIACLAVALVACETSEPPPAAPPAEAAEESPTAAPAAATACEAACRSFERCGLQPFDACTRQCPEVARERLELFAGASCEQLRTGDFGSQGFGCMRDGAQDCQTGMMCCVAHRAARRGEQGQCLYAALCYHRGY